MYNQRAQNRVLKQAPWARPWCGPWLQERVSRHPASICLRHKFQGSGDIADLVMEERPRFHPDFDMPAEAEVIRDLQHIEPVYRTDGRFCLTFGCAEGGKS